MVEELRGGAESVGERLEAAIKPRLRGVSHQWAFFVSLVLGAALVIAADSGEATIALGIYAASLSALLGTSALYHRVNWRRPEIRRWMRRLDHSMIFILIAGTYTPFAVLALEGALADALLVAVWIGAAAGIAVEMIWIEAPKWVTALVYIAVGWIGALAFPQLLDQAGLAAAGLIALGGILYTAGAVIYGLKRPNPSPRWFGFHEVLHALTVAAFMAHYIGVSIAAYSSGNA